MQKEIIIKYNKEEKMRLEINRRDKRILVIRFDSRREMNERLDRISNRYEGEMKNREGHNFPVEYIEESDDLYGYVRKNGIRYVIGVYNGLSVRHEELHARYYLDEDYRRKIEREWEEMEEGKREYIMKFLGRLGYSERMMIDEYQAYRYSEKDNFFGIKI